jgi:dienelactone hydrolase
MARATNAEVDRLNVSIECGGLVLRGELALPPGSPGLVMFVHGSGSSRHSPRNQFVAGSLQRAGLGTMLFDLLTEEEERAEAQTRHLRFDIPLLSGRIGAVLGWLHSEGRTARAKIGLFGASTGAAAALCAAADNPDKVAAVVSRGGRPDLAESALDRVRCPTLFLVGGDDEPVITINSQAFSRLAAAEKDLVVLPGASHLFEEPGKLEAVAELAGDWFDRFLLGRETAGAGPPGRSLV